MLKKMMLFSRQVALLLAFLMVFSSVAPAAERIVIAAHKCGPMAMLKNAGKDVNLLPFLQHKNGEVVTPSEYRSLGEAEYYLPADAKADAQKTAAAVVAEVKQFGVVKVPADCVKGNCNEEVARLNKQLDKAIQDKIRLVNDMSKQSALNNMMLENSMADTSFFKYVLGALAFLALLLGLGLGYKYAQHKYPGDLESTTLQRDLAEASLAELRASWNDLDKVEARLAELRAQQS